MKSVMVHDFGKIPQSEIQVSTFNLSHGVKTAFDSGYLVPVCLEEVLPSDTFEYDAEFLCRMLSPMVTSVMDNIFFDLQAFFVPSRLVWNNFVKMMGERVNPRDSIDYQVPMINSGENGFAVGSLADYFGIPTGVPNLDVSVLPFRCYAKIWDDWYRAEQLQDSIIQEYADLGDSNPNNINWNTLLRRGKRHDYFTSGLPSPQLGAGVELPLGGKAPVDTINGGAMVLAPVDGTDEDFTYNEEIFEGGLPSDLAWFGKNTGSPSLLWSTAPTLPTAGVVGLKPASLVADLSHATAVTINSLRTAFQLQRLLEADSRCGGMRYQELLKQHFKTLCPDARLQRSEYLGGSSSLINIHTVVQQSATDSVTPQGNRTANAACSSHLRFKKSFTEHGYVIILANVRCDLNYSQGLSRLWSRKGRYDFYWPTLAHLGEQAILNKEIYAQGKSVLDSSSRIIDDLPFAYQERYAEYRYHPSVITGKLRSTASGSLDVWHLGQYYTELPTLSPEWIEDDPPIDRVLAVQNEPQFLLDAFIGCKATRPLPTYGIPGLCDHF